MQQGRFSESDDSLVLCRNVHWVLFLYKDSIILPVNHLSTQTCISILKFPMSSISTYDELPPYEPRTGGCSEITYVETDTYSAVVSEAGLIIADEPDDESSIILSNESSEDGLSDYSSNGYSSDGYIGDLSSVGGGDSDIVSGSDRPRTQRGSVAHHEGELFV